MAKEFKEEIKAMTIEDLCKKYEETFYDLEGRDIDSRKSKVNEMEEYISLLEECIAYLEQLESNVVNVDRITVIRALSSDNRRLIEVKNILNRKKKNGKGVIPLGEGSLECFK
jgi:hypothetical protein